MFKPLLIAAGSAARLVSQTGQNLVYFLNAFRDQEKIQARITELESRLLTFEESRRENERLQKLLDFRASLPAKGIAARVIGWDPSPWRKTLVLDKGKGQGIRKDMAVVVKEGLAGRILDAGPSASRALLLTDPDARVSALADQSRAQGVVSGNGTSGLNMIYLELESGAAVGEMVLTSGIGGVYPKGLAIGKITSLGRASDGLHLEAHLEPFVKFSKLEEVLCLASSPEK